jgi:hypothetical protein
MKFYTIYRVSIVLYIILAIISFVGHLMFIYGDIVVASSISGSMVVFLLIGFGIVLYEHKKHPENFLDNPRIFGHNIENPVYKCVDALFYIYVLGLIFVEFFDVKIDYLPKSISFDFGFSGVVSFFVFSLVPIFDYRKKLLHEKVENI